MQNNYRRGFKQRGKTCLPHTKFVFSRSKMFRYSFFLFFFLLATGKANTVSPINRLIRLAFGVSKATYMPLEGSRYIQDGKIFGRAKTSLSAAGPHSPNEEQVCEVKEWTAKSYEKDNTELIVFKHIKQKLAIFGFRGTEATSFIDWKKNFDMKLTETSIGSARFKIHQGFRERYLDIAQWFENEYQALSEDFTIVITGHSLGGALSTIAAAYTSGKLSRRPDAVITFGSPLVGDKDFHEYYGKVVGCDRTLRIKAKFDLFTKVPGGKHYTHVCNALEVDGTEGWLGSLNFVKNHSLYAGYKVGLARKFSNVNKINFGCDKLLP